MGIAVAWFVVALFAGGLIDYWFSVTAYVFLLWWYVSACRSGRRMTVGVKSVTVLSLMLTFCKLYANTSRFIHLTATGPKFIRILEILATDFVLMFFPTLFLSPLLFSIFRRRRVAVTAVVVLPTFLFYAYRVLIDLKSLAVKIGSPSAQFLGAAAAFYLATMLIDPLLKARHETIPASEGAS